MAPPAATTQAYEQLVAKLRDIDALSGISGLLTWDEQVMMPEGAVSCRGNQKAALAGVLFDKRTDSSLGQLIAQLQAAPPGELSAVQAAVVRDAARSYKRETALPKELAQRMAKLETDGYVAWVEARKAGDWDKFAPVLQEWVDICKQKAAAIDPTRPAYDVLLDEYERGTSSARIDEVFTQVREGLVPLLAELRAKGSALDDAWIKGAYDKARQAELCREVALAIGFDTTHGRLDVSVHPFTGGAHPSDVRMTTRFKDDDLLEGLTGAIHETGHALYEQGRNLGEEWEGLPVSDALNMGIHESQSLFWERMVGLSQPFCRYLLPRIRHHFPDFPDRSPEELYAAINVMRTPSLIRVEADEVQYPLHIILRYEIERGLLDGSIQVSEVPRVWNAKMQQYLGVEPPSNAQGCLQDVHWSGGAIGYFPSYSLGAMYAVQLYEHAKAQLPGLEEQIAAGEFKPLKAWLNTKLHKLGSLHPSGDKLMVAVTGKPLDPAVFLKYLADKYRPLYGLS